MAKRMGEDVPLEVNREHKPNVKISWGRPKRRRCLDLNVKALFYFGFWPAEGRERRGVLFYWRYIYPRVQLIRMTYSIIFQTINVSLVWGNVTLMVEYYAIVFMYGMVLCKCLTAFFYREKLREMATTLEKLCSPRPTLNKELKVMMDKTDSSAQYMTNRSFSFGAVMITTVSIGLIIQGFIKRSIPFRRWFPYDAYSSPAFEITLICNYVLVPFDFVLVVIVDTLFIALTMNILGQFEVLKQKLSHVRVYVETIKKTKGHLTSLSECLRPTGRRLPRGTVSSRRPSEPEQSRVGRDSGEECFTVMGATLMESKEETGQISQSTNTDRKVESLRTVLLEQNRLPSWNLAGRESSGRCRDLADEISMMAMQANEVETMLRMEWYLKQCIKDHQQLIRLCSQLGQVFKLMLFYQVICNISCGNLILYATTLASSVDAKVIVLVLASCICYVQYFLFCWYGNRITEESVNVRDAIYDCDWFGASESFKRSMRIVILRTNKPIIIRAGGLPLSMRTFKKIYKAAYYLNMLLGKLINGEKIIQSKM